jgi:hypothetical protein
MYHVIFFNHNSTFVAVILIFLAGFTTTLYLHKCMQSVPIITDVENLNLDQGEVYNIM